jgi:hypothetical protein
MMATGMFFSKHSMMCSHFRGVPVRYDSRVDSVDNPHGYEEAFWHFVTRDEFVWNPTKRCKEKQRLIDTDRAEYLPWGRPTIEHECEPEVVVWDFDQVTKKGNVVRTYLWLKKWDYTVILERKSKDRIFMLITTFLVDVPAKRLDLESRYNRRK